MKNALICLAFVTSVSLSAQPSPEAKAQGDALKLRGDMAETVGKGTENSAAALVRLKKEPSPTGLNLDADADFAFAAIDLGRRLIAAGKPDDAEKFFREAEKSLDLAVKKTPDTAARDKAQYLQKLALIRSQYLGKVPQAKADLAEAIRLQPDDQHLRQTRDAVARDQAEHFKDKAQPVGRN